MANPNNDDQTPSIDVEATINLLDQRMARLRVLYEQYFLGIEKRQPNTAHKEVVRLIRVLENEKIKNTGLKFRYRGLVQKFNTYRTYWMRTCRQIENGTYSRHRQKAQDRQARQQASVEERQQAIAEAITTNDNDLAADFLAQLQGGPASPKGTPDLQSHTHHNTQPPALDPEEEARKAAVRAQRLQELRAKLGLGPNGAPTGAAPARTPQNNPQRPQTPGVIQRTPPPARPNAKRPPARGANVNNIQSTAMQAAGISNDRLKSIYNSLVDAKKRCSEPTTKISVDSIARSIAKQAPIIKQKHNARSVDFKVVIKNGKAYLKPIPKQ